MLRDCVTRGCGSTWFPWFPSLGFPLSHVNPGPACADCSVVLIGIRTLCDSVTCIGDCSCRERERETFISVARVVLDFRLLTSAGTTLTTRQAAAVLPSYDRPSAATPGILTQGEGLDSVVRASF